MRIGEIIDSKYEILEKIGAGGMGTVYKVKDVTTGKYFALKCCNSKDLEDSKRFGREAFVMSKIYNKNLIRIIDLNLLHESPYFIMPLAKGSVDSIIHKIFNDFNKVMRIFEEVCNGVIALHTSGNYHRDIKPSNFLVLPDNTVVVSDLGIVKDFDSSMSTFTETGKFLGSRKYAAPEQWNGKYADARTDVYLLGKSFYEMYTGDDPFFLDKRKLGGALYHILSKATDGIPDERYQTVSEFLDALVSYKNSLNPSLAPADAIKNKLLEIGNDLKVGNFTEKPYKEYVQLLVDNKDETDFIVESFDKIPHDILIVFVKKQTSEFKSVFEIYTDKLKEYYSRTRAFAYADVVTENMAVIFNSSNDDLIKSLALKNILRVAVWNNRFYAITVFYSLLQKISTQKEAEIVAVILTEEMSLFKQIAKNLPKDNLHPIIADLRNEAIKKLQMDEKSQDGDNDDWIAGVFA